MKLSYKNIRLCLFKWIGFIAIASSLMIASCGEGVNHNNQETEIRENDANTSQDEMKVDTTSSASYGGTDESTGRADTDTSSAEYQP